MHSYAKCALPENGVICVNKKFAKSWLKLGEYSTFECETYDDENLNMRSITVDISLEPNIDMSECLNTLFVFENGQISISPNYLLAKQPGRTDDYQRTPAEATAYYNNGLKHWRLPIKRIYTFNKGEQDEFVYFSLAPGVKAPKRFAACRVPYYIYFTGDDDTFGLLIFRSQITQVEEGDDWTVGIERMQEAGIRLKRSGAVYTIEIEKAGDI